MTPKNRMQIMQSVFGLTPGSVLTIPQIANQIGLDYEENTEAITALIENFQEQGIIAEVYPNCFVTETRAGGLKFLLVYTLIHDNIYVSNVAALEPRTFESLAGDGEFQGYYRDEEWPVELKEYLNDQNAKPCMSIAYGEPIPVGGHHLCAGVIYTGERIFLIDSEFGVSQRTLKVVDLFNGTLKNYRAYFKTHNEALQYAQHYTNPENQPQKRRHRGPALERRNDVLRHGNMGGECKLRESDVQEAEFTESDAPADQKRFSLNDINRAWERIPGFDNSPYAQKLKTAFTDDVLAQMI